MTAYRAQGITVDASHVLVDACTTRETFYVAMTRGSHTNDRLRRRRQARPRARETAPQRQCRYDRVERAVRRALAQRRELSAHETITAEQEAWGLIAQLAAEYETIAAAAQHGRWAALIRSSGLTTTSPPSCTTRVATATATATATARPAGSGRARKRRRLIAGLIPEATGTMTTETRQALTERRDLIEARADAQLVGAVQDGVALTPERGHLVGEDVHCGRSAEEVQSGVQGRGCEVGDQYWSADCCGGSGVRNQREIVGSLGW